MSTGWDQEWADQQASLVAAGDQLVGMLKPTLNLLADIHQAAKKAGLPDSVAEYIVRKYVNFFGIASGTSE